MITNVEPTTTQQFRRRMIAISHFRFAISITALASCRRSPNIVWLKTFCSCCISTPSIIIIFFFLSNLRTAQHGIVSSTPEGGLEQTHRISFPACYDIFTVSYFMLFRLLCWFRFYLFYSSEKRNAAFSHKPNVAKNRVKNLLLNRYQIQHGCYKTWEIMTCLWKIINY